MTLTLHPDQARQVGPVLYAAHRDRRGGIFGDDQLPYHSLPQEMERGSREHLHFITLTTALRTHRHPEALWLAARKTYDDAGTRYLFTPHAVAEFRVEKLREDMAAYGLAKRPDNDTDIWRRISTTLVQDFEGEACTLLAQANFEAGEILSAVRSSRHDFPYLGGIKTSSLWIHLLVESWQGQPIEGMQAIPVYTDRDVVAATVAIGAVAGIYTGPYGALEDSVEAVWTSACEGTDFYPMQFYHPLSKLGERGCREVQVFPCRRRTECPVMIFCVEAVPRKTQDGIEVGRPSELLTPISL